MVRRGAALVATVFALTALVPSLPGRPADAASAHRAFVIVDTGAGVHRSVVEFSSDSITGIQALQLAGANPVVYSFAGQGGAVCKLFGVGRDAGPNCLGGADGNPNYWAYFRAPAGTTGFTYSRAGAGSTQVHDGDVEGWRWGTGAAPAWSAIPPTTTTTTTTTTRPAPPIGGGPGPVAPGGGGTTPIASGSGAAITPDAAAAFAWAVAATSTTSTTVPATAAGGADVKARTVQRQAARRTATGGNDSGGSGDSSGAGSLAILAVILVALAGGGLLLRRSRRRPVP